MYRLKLFTGPIILGILLIAGCQTEKEPPPQLAYAGEEPRVQLPLSPEDSQKHIQLPEGFTAELYAAEPNIINPIAFTWDERGRLWVVQSQDYPHKLENDVGGDRITICEDTDNDGKADKFTDFATDQGLTTGITLVKGGAIVAQAPEMVFLEDTDGDDKVDKRTVLFDGFGIWDTHAGPSSLRYGIDNTMWGAVGYSAFKNKFQGDSINFGRGVYRFAKDGSFLEPVGQFDNNTWGMGYNENFEIFGSTANNNHACFVGIPLKHYDYLDKVPSWALNADFIQGHYEISPVDTVPLQQVDVRGGYTAAAGANFYTAKNYPKKYRNQMYVNAPTGHLVHIAKIVRDGAGYKEEDGGNIFASTDAWTAPVFTETGPDGNLWVADWYNPVVQHNPDKRGMENQIWNDVKGEGNAHINKFRDYRHGRIYIIKHEDGEDSEITDLDPNDDDALLAALGSDNQFWRVTAQRLIVEGNKTGLVGGLTSMVEDALEKEKASDGQGYENGSAALHALWTLQGLGAFEDSDGQINPLMENALSSKAYGVKRAALALMPETSESSRLLAASGLLTDSDPRVRLAAILRASELPENKELYSAMDMVALEEANRSDKWLDAAIKVYFREMDFEEVEASEVSMILETGEEQEVTWRYTVENPGTSWMAEDFDDTNWTQGKSPFGGSSYEAAQTAWIEEDIWMRKQISLTDPPSEPVIKITHNDDYEIYVNGELLINEEGYMGEYKYIKFNEDKAPLFKKGKNLIAVHCKNKGGDQHIAMGLGRMRKVEADISFVLNTVSQKMAYDKVKLEATAGQTVEIKLNNPDMMPHNLVVITPGSLETFGPLVDEFVTSADAEAMGYVPNSRYVLGATEMLDPNESGSVVFTLPDEPGIYPFVCTFPGHWRFMKGEIVVKAADDTKGPPDA